MSGFQGRLPLLLSCCFVVSIVLLAWRKLTTWEGVPLWTGLAVVVFYLVWLATEARVAVGETRMKSTTRDGGTLELYAAARFLTVCTALLVPSDWRMPWALVGTALLVCGVTFRLVAIRTLGRFYSHRVRLTDDHSIVQTGPYSAVRHPAYTGMLVAHLGFVLFFMSIPALCVFTLALVPAVVARILVEEKSLMQVPGYAEFARRRRRLLPLVW